MRWFTSDLHFGHNNIIPYCKRPFADKHEMTLGLVARWNEKVANGDLVYILGDLSFYGTNKTRAILDSMNGDKILIRGNHDHVSTEEKAKNLGLLRAADSDVVMIAGEMYNLSHFPYAGDTTKEDRYPERRLKDDGRWILHGHVHNEWSVRGKQINVGVDRWGWYPISEEAIPVIRRRALNDCSVQDP